MKLNNRIEEISYIVLELVALFLILSYMQAKACDPNLVNTDYRSAQSSGVISGVKRFDQNMGPIRNQGNSSQCYAYTTTELLEHKLKKGGYMSKDQHLSALATSIEYNISRFPNPKDILINYLLSSGQGASQIHTQAQGLQELYQINADILNRELRASKKFDRGKYYPPEKFSALMGPLVSSYLPSLTKDVLSQHTRYVEAHNRKNDLREHYEQMSRFYTSVAFFADIYQIPGVLSSNDSPSAKDDGGFMFEALSKAWDNLCLQSEVGDKFEQFFSDYESLILYLLELRHKDPQIICDSFNMIQDLFPSLPFNQPHEFLKFISSLYPYEEILKKLLSMCQQLDLSSEYFLPDPAHLFIPNVSRDNLFESIDGALEQGDIIGISYYGSILKTLGNIDKESRHASSVVGSMKICGEAFYVIRNSWGRDHCMKRYNELFSPHQRMPFYCDENGNHLIRKSELSRAIYGTTRVSEITKRETSLNNGDYPLRPWSQECISGKCHQQ